MPPGEIQTCNPSKREFADSRLRPRGYQDRLYICYGWKIKCNISYCPHFLAQSEVSPATFTLEQGWQTFLRACAQIVYKFRRNPVACPWGFRSAKWGLGVFHKLLLVTALFFSFLWRCDPTRIMASSFLMFLDHKQRRSTVGRTPLDVWSARRRDLYLTTHNTHNRQTSMPPVGFEPTISAGERPKTHALDRAATGTGSYCIIIINK